MAKIPEYTIEKIKDSNDIVDLVSSYLPLKKKGANYWARCPFHDEKTASFSVSPSKQIFHCFGCGVGGNVINFVMEYEKLSFIESVKLLAERANIPLDHQEASPREKSDTGKLREMHVRAIEIYHRELFSPNGKKAMEYLNSRGISKQTVQTFKVGFAPDSWDFLVSKLSEDHSTELILKSGLCVQSQKDNRLFDRFRGRIMFPVMDERGNAVGFGGRTLPGGKDDAKYLNSPETPIYNKRRILYGLNVNQEIIRKEKKALVVEGYMDLLQLYQHGFINVVAGSGTAFTGDHARLLRRFADEAVLCYDSDEAGQKAAVRTAFTLASQKLDCRILKLPEGEDPDSYLQNEGADAFFKREANALPMMEFLREYYQPSSMSPRDKAETIAYLLEEIRAFPDPVYRETFAREIATLFSVEESTLLQQLNRRAYRRPASGKAVFSGEKPKHFKNQGEAAEYYLLQLLVNGSVLIRKAGLRYLSPVLFRHAFLRKVLEGVLPVLQKDPGIPAGQIPDRIGDNKIRNFVIQLLIEAQNSLNQETIFVESLRQLELQVLREKYNALTEELKKADPSEVPGIMKKQIENLEARKRLKLLYTPEIFKEIDA